jgi:hypothetical protein
MGRLLGAELQALFKVTMVEQVKTLVRVVVVVLVLSVATDYQPLRVMVAMV